MDIKVVIIAVLVVALVAISIIAFRKKRQKVALPDMRAYVSNAPYLPRNLIPKVVRFPSGMPQEKQDALRTILELHLSEIGGVSSGSVLHMESNGCYGWQLPESSPYIEISEKYGKPIVQVLDDFTKMHVLNRMRTELEHGGLDILLIEPDPTYSHVMDAWLLRGVAFSNTGIAPQGRFLDRVYTEDDRVRYHIPLLCAVVRNPDVHKLAKDALNQLNDAAHAINTSVQHDD